MKVYVRATPAALLVLVICCAAAAQRTREEPPQRRRQEPGPNDLMGKIAYYTSQVDGEERPYVICATDESDTPKPAVLVVSPGGTGLQGAQYLTGQFATTIRDAGKSAVILRPTGRGGGSLYMNYGEVDLLEALRDAMSKYAIDPDRISVMGHSMGGAATWYLTSHYPDLFSAGNPSAGYCDYRLWEKPGGYTFHMQEWEEPSWIARSAVFVPENFMHTPMWVIHGELDRSIGGGVPVEHSRRMTKLLDMHGCPYRYTEVPGYGHHFLDKGPEITKNSLLWLIDQKRERSPEHVKLAAYTLRHNKSYWVTLEQLERYGERGMVDAEFLSPERLIVRVQNVRTFSLGPASGRTAVKLNVEGQEMGDVNLSSKAMFRRGEGGKWEAGDFDLSNEKRHSCSGPIADLFFDNTILVAGASGSEAEARYNRSVAGHQASRYKERNGGVHRGGIMGDNIVDLLVVNDSELTEEERKGSNLILYGTFESNSIMKMYEGKLPIEFDGNVIRVGGRTYAGDKTTIFCVLPHPENPDRYVAVHGGVTDDAITYGSHIDLGLLPDYLVYSGGQVLDWGFWGNDWQKQP